MMPLPSSQIGRWPVPSDARSVLIFGGSFDPPHRGHFELPLLARERLGCDWLVYVPARQSPHKRDRPEASDEQRLEMLRVGLGAVPCVSISTIELERDPADPSYTIDTLREIRSLAGSDVELRLLIGEDQARAFDRWKDPDQIATIAPPVVMMRSGHSAGPLPSACAQQILDLPVIEVSATALRRALAGADPSGEYVTTMIPGPVLEIIRRAGLYREGLTHSESP